MLRAGITGGIGSGKTTVCRIFETLGVPVYYADDEARGLYVNSPELKQEIIASFGEQAYLPDGNINKSYLRELAFGNPETGRLLNAIVHPHVFRHYEAWCEQHADHDYTLKEAAILFESGSYQRLHTVIGVAAPLETRILRTMERDGISREAVLERINRQMPQDELLKRCRFIINNDGEHSLISQVLNLHREMTELSDHPQPFLA